MLYSKTGGVGGARFFSFTGESAVIPCVYGESLLGRLMLAVRHVTVFVALR